MGEPLYMKYPTLSLAQDVFTIAAPQADLPSKQASLQRLQEMIQEHKMAPLYHYLAHPQTGKLNSAGESSSHAAKSDMPSLQRTTSVTHGGIVGVLGGTTQTAGLDLAWDENLYNNLKAENEKELDAIKKEEDEAVEKAGETEVQTAKGKRAEFYTRIGDKDAALAAFEALMEKTGILSSKIDIVLAIIRIGLFFDDKVLVKKNIERAATLIESGGDWDRRNRLKAYQGLHLMTIRAHNLAAPLLLDSLSTFTSNELCSYSNLVAYAVLAGSISLPRRDFKSKVVDSAEIRAILGSETLDPQSHHTDGSSMDVDTISSDSDKQKQTSSSATPRPVVNLTSIATSGTVTEEPQLDFSPLAQMIRSLYHGQYTSFLSALADVETTFLIPDRYLYEHRRWFVKEMRLRAYTQLLQSYRVVSLESMAKSFGVGAAWLDKDLAPFIASGRLGATIDRVKGVVETRREEGKNKQ